MFAFNNIDPKDLLEEINRIRKVLINPQEYIWEHFYDMKNEIDLEFEQVLNNLMEDDDTKEKLTNYWNDIIEKIDQFKTECLQKNFNFIQIDSIKHIETLNDIEQKLSIQIKSKSFLDIFTNYKFKNFKEIKALIDQENNNINSKLFNNKTYLYLNRSNCNKYEKLNKFSIYYRKNLKDLIGRLLIVKDCYINSIDLIYKFVR